VRRIGNYPANEDDGVLVADSKVRDQFATTGFVDSGLQFSTEYFYQAFPYSDTGAINRSPANRASITTGDQSTYKTYGVSIDLTNPNPETSVTYTDDAVGVLPDMSSTLGAKAVGDIVRISEGGIDAEFIIVHKGSPSALYQGLENGVVLLRRNVLPNRQWHSTNSNDYQNSSIHAWLNGDYSNLITQNIRNRIKQVRIPFRPGSGTSQIINSGANGLQCRLFLLSLYEVGGDTSNMQGGISPDGTKLDWFVAGTTEIANARRVVPTNASWWQRTPRTVDSSAVQVVSANGGIGGNVSASGSSIAPRPAFVLPDNLIVSPDGTVTDVVAGGSGKPTDAWDSQHIFRDINPCLLKDGEVQYYLDKSDFTQRSANNGGETLRTKAVGDIVKISESGADAEFIIVQKGSPSALYEGFENSVVLLRREIIPNRQWHSSNVNDYASSLINLWLNNEYIDTISQSIRNHIRQVRIPYRAGSGTSTTISSGTNGLQCHVFNLSFTEVGGGTNANAPSDGTIFAHYNELNTANAEIRRVAYRSGTAQPWWTRSPILTGAFGAWVVGANGDISGSNANGSLGHRPAFVLPDNLVVLPDGTVTAETSGGASNLTGADGDVMIEFPKTGFRINTQGNTLTVQVTDDPNKEGFRYYAHTRDVEGDREKLYIGAYKASFGAPSNRLRSVSGAPPGFAQAFAEFRTRANANGKGYDLISFYPLTLLQALYTIRFKNLNSQAALGRGYGGGTKQNTGATNTEGMFYGNPNSLTDRVKCFGLEDFWGNCLEIIDGVRATDPGNNILTAFSNFRNDGEGYINNGNHGSASVISGFMSKPQGTTERGFITREANGSATTFFSNAASLNVGLALHGGDYQGFQHERFGIFYLSLNSGGLGSDNTSSRLMYL